MLLTTYLLFPLASALACASFLCTLSVTTGGCQTAVDYAPNPVSLLLFNLYSISLRRAVWHTVLPTSYPLLPLTSALTRPFLVQIRCHSRVMLDCSRLCFQPHICNLSTLPSPIPCAHPLSLQESIDFKITLDIITNVT
jgi:hypothetical protein